MQFEWDFTKERINVEKHGIWFIEAVETFYDPKGVQLKDLKHSSNELRFYWVGRSKSGRILTTWFAERDGNIRIIWCAEWRKFRRFYNERT